MFCSQSRLLTTVIVIQEMGKSRGKKRAIDMESTRNGLRQRQRKVEENYFELIPEEINTEILSRLPFPTVFQAKIVCSSWRTIICSSPQFQKQWDERNSEQWLVRDDCDHGGIEIFNASGGFKKKMMFDSSSSNWLLNAASGGLLLYQHKSEGLLRTVNPLTMEAQQLPDPLILGGEHVSFYLNAKLFSIDLIVDSITRIYQVIVISIVDKIWNLLIYRSSTSCWEINVLETRSAIKSYWFQYKTVDNQTVYCIPVKGRALPSYNICGEIVEAQETFGGELKGFVIGENVKVALWNPRIGRCLMFVFEFDEAASQWKVVSVCRWNSRDNRVSTINFGELLCEKDFGLTSLGASEDCIWIVPRYKHLHQTRLMLQQQRNIFKGYREDKGTAFPMTFRFSQCP